MNKNAHKLQAFAKEGRISKTISFILAVAVMVSVVAIPVSATAVEPDDFATALTEFLYSYGSNPKNTYLGYNLEWTDNNSGRDLLTHINTNEIDVSYTYDNNDNRISKCINSNCITYQYNSEGLLIEENRNGAIIQYCYEFLLDSFGVPNAVLTSFVYEGTTYYFSVDDDGTVVAILNDNGTEIVRYIYEYGVVKQVLSLSNVGDWVDATNDELNIGKINRIRYLGYYFDEETKWYYCGRYYDSTNNRFIDGQTENDTFDYCNFPRVLRTVPSDLHQQIYSLAYQCYNDPNFGAPIAAGSGWYTALSNVEILARLIYGEQTKYTNEQRAVAWVVVNRVYSSDPFFPDTLRGVMTQSSQFSTISGSGSNQARQPATSSDGWTNAISVASIVVVCLEYYANGNSYLDETLPRPNGISNQVAMLGMTGSYGFLTRATNGQNCILIDGRPVTQVTVVDCATNCTSISGFTSFNDYTRRNVFYNIA